MESHWKVPPNIPYTKHARHSMK
jgi:hypothetical protein